MSRDEIYLNAILTGDTSNLPEPISRVDRYLYQIAISGTGSSGTAFEYQNSHTQYYLSPQSAGTGTANEMQVFVDGKVIPINIVPYDLSSVQWRTYYIISWHYREDLNQTQILFIASDPTAIINVVCLPVDVPNTTEAN